MPLAGQTDRQPLIAIIGWGSLIWCPGSLRIATRWRIDGPKVPVEFKRVSSDGRLTLVVEPEADAVPTCWAESELSTSMDAAADLAAREGHEKTPIGIVTRGDAKIVRGTLSSLPSKRGEPEAAAQISGWLKKKPVIAAAVWTALGPKDVEDGVSAVSYLRQLQQTDDLAFNRAREYIENAPVWIDTPARRAIFAAFGTWKARPPGSALFDP